MTATVIICTRLRAAQLDKCLEAVAELKPPPNEVVVVDNSEGDPETLAVAQRHSARYIVEPRRGLSRARNRGLDHSNSEIAAFLDDDAIPDKRWLELLTEPFVDPRVGVVTGAICVSKSKSSESTRQPTRFLSNKDRQWFEIAAFGGLGIGASMALRTAACNGSKVFDERLGRGAPFHGMEEHHAFVCMLERDYCAAHVPAAIVTHFSQDASDRNRDARNAIAYSILLFAEFPGHRIDVMRFLFRRLRRKPLTWARPGPDPGEVITSAWRVQIKAILNGTLLYLRSRAGKSD